MATRPLENNGLGLTPRQAERVLARVESSVVRLPESDDVYAEWRRLVVAHGISGKKTHDARIVAAMLVHGLKHVLTFNVSDLRVIRISWCSILLVLSEGPGDSGHSFLV